MKNTLNSMMNRKKADLGVMKSTQSSLRLLLLVPPYNETIQKHGENLGIRYLVAYLNKYGVEVDLMVPGPKSISEGPIPHIESNKYILQKTEIPELKQFIINTDIPFELDYLNLAFINFG